MLQCKVDRENNGSIDIGWRPDKKALEIAFKEIDKKGGYEFGDLSSALIASACDDLSCLVSHFYKFIDQKMGAGMAELFKKAITEHPDSLFSYIKGGDIRDADFY